MHDRGHERLIGRTIAGKFLVEQLLGAGAMGAVFRARQVALEKTVAIKVLHGEHAHDALFAARFHREAKAASRLNHPNSMQVIDFGAEPDGLLYIAMEYLDGRSLHQVLREEWPLAPARIADLLMQTLAALAVAHDMGVVHRDLKPENIMVLRGTDDDGRSKDVVKVCDFGIAKITDSRAYRGADRESTAPVTTAGFLVGTPEYMSPEQGRGEKLDARSDLYSVGVILFELLTRRVPFEAGTALGVVLKHVGEAPARPSLRAAGVDLRLESICLRALRKSPHERYRDAREMRSELRAVIEGSAIFASAPWARGTAAASTPAFEATIAMDTEARPALRGDDDGPKPTLLGTSATIPGVSARRALVIAGVALGALVSAAASTALILTLMRPRPGRANSSATANPSASSPPWTVLAAETPGIAADTAAPDRGRLAGNAPARGQERGESSPPAWPSRPPPPALKATLTAVAQTDVGSVPPAAPGPSPLPRANGSASANSASLPLPTVAPGPPVTAMAAPEPFDPTFDPDRGYVEIGLINAQGARDFAVRAALRGIGLAHCYRIALRARGTRVQGTATLDLSFDSTGAARAAIVTGAEFLPGLTRCLQAVSSAARIPGSQVDLGGGTAEVVLAFKAP